MYICAIKRYNYIQDFFSHTPFLGVLLAFLCFNISLLQANDAKGFKGKSHDQIHLVGGVKVIENKVSPLKSRSSQKPKILILQKKKVQQLVIKHNTVHATKNPESIFFYSVMGRAYNKLANYVQVLLLFLSCQLGLVLLFVLVKKTGKKYIDVFTSRFITYSLYSRPPTFL